MFRAALIQMRVEGGQPAANLDRALALIDQAARRGCQLVVLPECMPLGWTHPSARQAAEPVPGGLVFERLRQAALKQRLYVCSGLVERSGERLYNSAILLNPDGELLLRHRKINELDIGHDLYALGDQVQTVETPLGRLGLMICADAFVRGQAISRTLGFMGAQVILSPSSWAVPADHDHDREPYGQLWLDNYCPVARDFALWIIGVSNVGWITGGPWQGRRCIGCSLVVGPDGKAVLQGRYGVDAEEILVAEIEPQPRPAQGTGWEDLWRKRDLG